MKCPTHVADNSDISCVMSTQVVEFVNNSLQLSKDSFNFDDHQIKEIKPSNAIYMKYIEKENDDKVVKLSKTIHMKEEEVSEETEVETEDEVEVEEDEES
jgi:hypothetical protein